MPRQVTRPQWRSPDEIRRAIEEQVLAGKLTIYWTPTQQSSGSVCVHLSRSCPAFTRAEVVLSGRYEPERFNRFPQETRIWVCNRCIEGQRSTPRGLPQYQLVDQLADLNASLAIQKIEVRVLDAPSSLYPTLFPEEEKVTAVIGVNIGDEFFSFEDRTCAILIEALHAARDLARLRHGRYGRKGGRTNA